MGEENDEKHEARWEKRTMRNMKRDGREETYERFTRCATASHAAIFPRRGVPKCSHKLIPSFAPFSPVSPFPLSVSTASQVRCNAVCVPPHGQKRRRGTYKGRDAGNHSFRPASARRAQHVLRATPPPPSLHIHGHVRRHGREPRRSGDVAGVGAGGESPGDEGRATAAGAGTCAPHLFDA